MKSSLKFLRAYKNDILSRIILVFSLSALWWLFFSDHSLRATFGGIILIGYAEMVSMNVFFERDYYPLDLFVDDWFPDKKSLGNKFIYFGYYLLFMVFTAYVLFFYSGFGSVVK